MNRTWNAKEFNSLEAKKAAQFECEESGNLGLHIVSPGNILIAGIDAITGEEVYLYSGQGIIHIRTNYEGFTAFSILSDKPGSYRVTLNGKATTEQLNDDAPPPPKQPKNLLQAMRQNVQSNLVKMREGFDNGNLPGYEVDDDATFEEETGNETASNQDQETQQQNVGSNTPDTNGAETDNEQSPSSGDQAEDEGGT